MFPIAIEKCVPVPRILADVGMISLSNTKFPTQSNIHRSRCTYFQFERTYRIDPFLLRSGPRRLLSSFIPSSGYHQLPPENSRGPVLRHPSLVVLRQHGEVIIVYSPLSNCLREVPSKQIGTNTKRGFEEMERNGTGGILSRWFCKDPMTWMSRNGLSEKAGHQLYPLSPIASYASRLSGIL